MQNLQRAFPQAQISCTLLHDEHDYMYPARGDVLRFDVKMNCSVFSAQVMAANDLPIDVITREIIALVNMNRRIGHHE